MTYCLKSENLTHLGGPMGSEYTTTNFCKYFSSVSKAKDYAEKDYKKTRGQEKIIWIKTKTGIRSPDLLWVMYYIDIVKEEA